MTTRRKFLASAGIGTAATALGAPSIVRAQAPIKWRFQTYAGAALGEHVTKPAIDYINTAANGEMEIELFYADQISASPYWLKRTGTSRICLVASGKYPPNCCRGVGEAMESSSEWTPSMVPRWSA